MSKIPIWRYSGLSGGRRANHTAASLLHTVYMVEDLTDAWDLQDTPRSLMLI